MEYLVVTRRNKNRGYQQLRVWQDAIELYRCVCDLVRDWPYERKRLASQSMAAADSIHRNIAEGYCRRSIKEYLNFLNIALASLGETVSAIHAYRSAEQISDEDFEVLDSLAYRLENARRARRRLNPTLRYSTTPLLRHSTPSPKVTL